MFDIVKELAHYRTAVDRLDICFGDHRAQLVKGDKKTAFSYFTEELAVDWLINNLAILVEDLLPANFVITLIIQLFNKKAELKVFKRQNMILCECNHKIRIEYSESIPDNAANDFETLRDVLSKTIQDFDLSDLLKLLATLKESGIAVSLSLGIFLNKSGLNEAIKVGIDNHDCSEIYCFLFSESVLDKFRNTSLRNLENEYFKPEKRTIFVVFGISGHLKGDLLAIFGSDPASIEALSAMLSSQIPEDTLKKENATIDFREAQNLWLRPTKCFFPETFSLAPTFDQNNPELKDVYISLQAYQVLLSIIYLADYVEVNPGDPKEENPEEVWTVEFRGMGSTRLVFRFSELFGYKDNWNNVYQLYRYSFDRFSTDKLEITQQFMSIIVEHLNALFTKASEIQDATKKVYDKNLIHEVKDYFAARQTIQEKLRIAVRETSDNVIDLTRDVSSDVYKILGAVLAGVVSYIIKPEIGLWAILAASLTYAAYIGLAAFYHLPTIVRTNTMRILQHTKGVKSFQDILRNIEIQEVVDDKNLRDASRLFEEKVKWAGIFYKVSFAVSLLIALISVFLLLNGDGSSP